MKEKLTEKQNKCLSFIKNYIKEMSVCPSMEQIGEHMKITRMGARNHIVALERKGYIVKDFNKHRSIRVVK
jgi:SOS-response transcriptional repressor LexA